MGETTDLLDHYRVRGSAGRFLFVASA